MEASLGTKVMSTQTSRDSHLEYARLFNHPFCFPASDLFFFSERLAGIHAIALAANKIGSNSDQIKSRFSHKLQKLSHRFPCV